LRRGHFERWLWLWRATVEELFAGERAELAKAHAARVATAFHARLDAVSAPEDHRRRVELPVAHWRAASEP
jgi:hemoglobin